MKKVVLDQYEREIEDALASGEFISVADLEDSQELFAEAAKNYQELQKTRSVTLRVNQEDLIKIKAMAKKSGIAYQTLINLLINQYVKREKKIIL